MAGTVAPFYSERMSASTPDAAPIPPGPRCSATHVVRNGANASGTPVFRGPRRGRRFVAAPKT